MDYLVYGIAALVVMLVTAARIRDARKERPGED